MEKKRINEYRKGLKEERRQKRGREEQKRTIKKMKKKGTNEYRKALKEERRQEKENKL